MIQLLQNVQFVKNTLDYFVWMFADNLHCPDLISGKMHNHEHLAASTLPNLFNHLIAFSIRASTVNYKEIPVVDHIVFRFLCDFHSLLSQRCLHSCKRSLTTRSTNLWHKLLLRWLHLGLLGRLHILRELLRFLLSGSILIVRWLLAGTETLVTSVIIALI